MILNGFKYRYLVVIQHFHEKKAQMKNCFFLSRMFQYHKVNVLFISLESKTDIIDHIEFATNKIYHFIE